MNPESIRWKSISNHINGLHAHPCNHSHAKTQTADRADHVDRDLFSGEFRLLQLARHWQIHSWPITQSTSILTQPYSVTTNQSYSDSKTFLVKFNLACSNFFTVKFFGLSGGDPGYHLLRSHSTFLTSRSVSLSTQITSCCVGLICTSSRNLTPQFYFAR